jgi:hypothetical protein
MLLKARVRSPNSFSELTATGVDHAPVDNRLTPAINWRMGVVICPDRPQPRAIASTTDTAPDRIRARFTASSDSRCC